MPTLGILFDIDKLDSTVYGSVAWDVFWRAVGPESLTDGMRLFEGDTAVTLIGNEQVYCLAVASSDGACLDALRTRLAADVAYGQVAAEPRFLTGHAVEREPLPEVGQVVDGHIVGARAVNPRAALGKLKRERTTTEPLPVVGEAPARPRPASSRTADLPALATLEELLALLVERFAGELTDMRVALTPEELCDMVEAYDSLVTVHWEVGETLMAESAAFVNLFGRDTTDACILLFGLLRFPSRGDAEDYCEREHIAPREWGLRGVVVANFVGLDDLSSIDPDQYREVYAARAIAAEELWERIHRRRRELKIDAAAVDPADSPAKPPGPTAPTPSGGRKWWQFWR